ncbi:MAG: hypothetical protein JWQ00_1757 [Noviherbaspirillum sp.]|nr:hypothetical protein [Noviherbaspirillum sp.]
MTRESATNPAMGKWLAGAAVGALAMYLEDPERGRRRRALARDKMQRLAANAGDAVNIASRDLSNRIQGLRVEATRRLFKHGGIADDQLLEERVRAKIGRAASHPHAIKTTAHEGRVTLSGPVLASEKEQLLQAVRGVPGVKDIEDALEVHDRPDIASLQGQGKRRRLRPAILQENWPPALRAIATVGGGVLGYYGLKRRTPMNILFAAFGLGVMARGMTNMPLKRVAGMDPDRPPVHLQKTIHISAPPETVYEFWSSYENFPHFMSNVEKVTDLGYGRSHWVVKGPAGTMVEFDAVLVEQKYPEVIAWKSEPDSVVHHKGRVRFEPVDDGTRVTVAMDYSPPAGMIGHAVASVLSGDPKTEMDEDLMRMKSFIESGIPPHDAAKPLSHESRAVH